MDTPPLHRPPLRPVRLHPLASLQRLASHGACALALGWAGLPATHAAPQAPHGTADLVDLSLEQLAQVRVTSVSRKVERPVHTPAAAFVISSSDIRRSGATTLPEALRLAPNLDVARADANQYAISARGFNDVLSNKLLVMVDGRALYSPLFSGVFWDAQTLPLDLVDRIEVISGPVGTMWGGNAFNGVIHIVTKRPVLTQGLAASAQVSSDRHDATVRHGDRFDGGAWRVHAHSFDQRGMRLDNGSPADDRAHGAQAGVRADGRKGPHEWSIDLQGHQAHIGQGASQRRASGTQLRGRLTRDFSPERHLLLQAVIEQAVREQPGLLAQRLDIVDLAAQYRFAPKEDHDVVAGGLLRSADDRVTNTPVASLTPPERRLNWARLFVQDEVSLSPRLSLSAGAAWERNPYTGWELLPNLRMAWRASETNFFWSALSRAVRAPSRSEREYTEPGFISNPRYDAEVATVLELGHRGQPTESISYSATLFANRYEHLRSTVFAPGGLTTLGNDLRGHALGLEAWGGWRVNDRLRLDAGLTLLRQRLRVDPAVADAGSAPRSGNDPRHRWSLAATLEPAPAHSLWLSLRRTGARPAPAVPSYVALDARWSWRVNPQLELALALRNLLDDAHPEWGANGSRVNLGREAALQLRWNL